MENFPTRPRNLVPRVANLLTLAFLVGTTWWSGAQRPVAQAPALALNAAPAIAPDGRRVSQVAVPADTAAPVARPAVTSTLATDGLISVGYTGASLR